MVDFYGNGIIQMACGFQPDEFCRECNNTTLRNKFNCLVKNLLLSFWKHLCSFHANTFVNFIYWIYSNESIIIKLGTRSLSLNCIEYIIRIFASRSSSVEIFINLFLSC